MKATLTRFFQLVPIKQLTHAELYRAVVTCCDIDILVRLDSFISEEQRHGGVLSKAALKIAYDYLSDHNITAVVVDQAKRMRWFNELFALGVGLGYDYKIKANEVAWIVFFDDFHQVYVYNGKDYKVYTSDNLHSYMLIKALKPGAKRVMGNDGEYLEVGSRDEYAAYDMTFSPKASRGVMALGRTPYFAFCEGYGLNLA